VKRCFARIADPPYAHHAEVGVGEGSAEEETRREEAQIEAMWKASASHLLGIYECRRDMARKGVTHPLPEILRFCEELVDELERLAPETTITVIDGQHGETDFMALGRTLATLPPIRPAAPIPPH
jgi:hypothetical protein